MELILLSAWIFKLTRRFQADGNINFTSYWSTCWHVIYKILKLLKLVAATLLLNLAVDTWCDIFHGCDMSHMWLWHFPAFPQFFPEFSGIFRIFPEFFRNFQRIFGIFSRNFQEFSGNFQQPPTMQPDIGSPSCIYNCRKVHFRLQLLLQESSLQSSDITAVNTLQVFTYNCPVVTITACTTDWGGIAGPVLASGCSTGPCRLWTFAEWTWPRQALW